MFRFSCLAFAFLFPCSYLEAKDGVVWPVGIHLPGVQFDGVVTVATDAGDGRQVFFAKYWVASNSFQMSLDWAEPHGRRTQFPSYAPGLSISSDAETFKVRNDEMPEKDQDFLKPLGDRGVFRFMYGDYAIGNIRFAETDAQQGRLHVSDFMNLRNSGTQTQTNHQVSIPHGDGSSTKSIVYELGSTNGQVVSIDLLNEAQKVIKTVTYKYDGDGETAQLRETHTYLPERSIVVGFRGQGMKIGLEGTTNQFRELPMLYRKGGRKIVTNYRFVDLGPQVVTLPVLTEVRRAEDGEHLHSAELTNFKLFDPSRTQTGSTDKQLSTSSSGYREYMAFQVKYWKSSPDKVSAVDRSAIRELRARFTVKTNETNSTVGELLRRANARIGLSRILGDREQLEQEYAGYLQTLHTNGFSDLAVVGGYDVVDTSVIWGRNAEANSLMKIWIEAANQIKDNDLILRVVSDASKRAGAWATVQLVDTFSARFNTSPTARFELGAAKCLALQEVLKMYKGPTNSLSRVQWEWISTSIGSNQLEELIETSKSEALTSFSEIKQPLKRHEELAQRLKTAK